jgi:hypothetical protein
VRRSRGVMSVDTRGAVEVAEAVSEAGGVEQCGVFLDVSSVGAHCEGGGGAACPLGELGHGGE